MARLTLDQINQLTPDMAGYLQSLGYSIGGEADDGSMRYMDSEGNLISPGNAQEIFSDEALQGYGADQRRMQGIIDIADYDDPGSIAEYAKKGWSSPEAYLSQLYGGGERVGDYFVLPQAGDVRAAQMVGTPIVYNSPGLFKEFITNAALLAGAGYGLNALTTGGFGGLGGAGAVGGDAAWGVNAAGSGAGTAAGTAAGEFGLSGATAGNLAGTGGLSSTAGLGLGANAGTGALGLGSGAAGAAAFAPTSTALLTPALAGAAGLGAVQSGLTAAQTMGGVTPSALTPDIAAQQAIDGSAQTIYDAAANAGVPGYDPALVSGVGSAATTAAGAGTALSRLLDGTATASDYAQLASGLVTGVGGVVAANQQSDAYEDLANRYMAMGAPYRDKLAASYQPGFSMADQPDFQNALDVGAQAAARATSARSGNPVDNPGAYAEMQKYITGSLALPQLNTYRSQLGSFGQLGTNTAGTLGGAAINAQGGGWEALGSGIEDILNPRKRYDQQIGGVLSQLAALNTGRSF